MKELVSLRTSKLSSAAKDYIEKEMKKKKKRSQILISLIEKGITKTKIDKNLLQTRNESIESHQTVFRKKPILIPCPNTMRWMDLNLDCRRGCKLKCQLTKFDEKLIRGLLLLSKPIHT